SASKPFSSAIPAKATALPKPATRSTPSTAPSPGTKNISRAPAPKASPTSSHDATQRLTRSCAACDLGFCGSPLRSAPFPRGAASAGGAGNFRFGSEPHLESHLWLPLCAAGRGRDFIRRRRARSAVVVRDAPPANGRVASPRARLPRRISALPRRAQGAGSAQARHLPARSLGRLRLGG